MVASISRGPFFDIAFLKAVWKSSAVDTATAGTPIPSAICTQRYRQAATDGGARNGIEIVVRSRA